MEELIKNILNESGYTVLEGESVEYYTREEKSYFFLVNISETDFKNFKNSELITENEQYKKVLDSFTKVVNEGEQISIEKNSSLIVLVKCDRIESIDELQQQVLLFEEDEYFFKKYVILYTDESISQITNVPIIPILRDKVGSVELFNEFASKGCITEISEYVVAMELFIKLPFLNLEEQRGGFSLLSQKLDDVLAEDATLYNTLLNKAEEIKLLDFSRLEDEAAINDLLSFFP